MTEISYEKITHRRRHLGVVDAPTPTRGRGRGDGRRVDVDRRPSRTRRRIRVGFASDGCRMCPFDESRLNREWVRLPRAPWTRPTDRQNAERRDRASAVATREGMTASSVDDFCHLPRDLSVGDVGGDVHCLQRALRRGEFSNVAPSGRFDEATREGVKRWTTANGWSNRTGSVDASVRSAYAEVRARRGDSRSFVVFRRARRLTDGRDARRRTITRRCRADDW